MAQLGRINQLTVKRIRDYGVHLDGGELGDILLPKKHVPKDCAPGDSIEVFVYSDTEGHLRATPQKPYASVGQFAKLRVVTNTPVGAFLDWGLQKDLFVPKNEQLVKMEEGTFYVVYVFLDEKTNRITASSKVDKFLSRQPPTYKAGEEVNLLIYDKTVLGYKAIVNNTHWGVLYKNELFRKLTVGLELKGYIKKVREDQKIDLTLLRPGYQKIDEIAQTILMKIKEQGGRVPVTDDTPPETIYTLFGISKKVFKQAIGALYKKRLITMDANGIKLVRR
ncbi:MAG: GntR family transcriptional regulator [Proteobacteria bacterium]|nr:GntR family transcriptional regulator [Pseudomonadota bacterium]MBU1688827.1 GntR family transcriptional regulator [Pseudomonadota bacterium]